MKIYALAKKFSVIVAMMTICLSCAALPPAGTHQHKRTCCSSCRKVVVNRHGKTRYFCDCCRPCCKKFSNKHGKKAHNKKNVVIKVVKK